MNFGDILEDIKVISSVRINSLPTYCLLMFKVITPESSQTFDRWTDALNTAKSFIPQCKWFDQIRILEGEALVWTYSRSHKYPQFIGAGTYDRLAKRFLWEAVNSDDETTQETAEEH